MVATANQDNAKTGEEMKKTDKQIKRLIIEKPSITLNAQTSCFDLNNKIKIPKVVFYNIAEIVEVTINFRYEQVE